LLRKCIHDAEKIWSTALKDFFNRIGPKPTRIPLDFRLAPLVIQPFPDLVEISNLFNGRDGSVFRNEHGSGAFARLE